MVQEEEIRAVSGVVPLNRSLSGQRLPQQYQQQQPAPGLPMAGRPPTAGGVSTPHYNPQQFTPASTMMMAQQQQRPQQQQQQQRPPVTATAAGTQVRGGSYLQQAQQQYPPAQYVHHMTSVPMSNMSAARPGVAPGAAYGNMQNLAVAQQHNMQARQKPNQVQTPGTQYIGGVAAGQQQALRQGPSIASQQQQQQALQHQQQQQQVAHVQQMTAQRLAPQQQQAMARQTQSQQQQQMLQNQGNMRVVSAGQVWQGKPTTQYQQQTQAQQAPQQQQPSPQQQQQPPQPRPPVAATTQARPTTPQVTNPAPAEESTGSILGKRSIQDLLAQIDPRERLDPDVEEVFLEIADDFIENVASFSCKIAQHRKSKILEAKDVLLHLDKAYNITVPGFGGDEYRSYKRPSVSETHKQRLAVVRKSAAAGQETKVAVANVSTPVKAVGVIATGASPTPSLGMPRIPRV